MVHTTRRELIRGTLTLPAAMPDNIGVENFDLDRLLEIAATNDADLEALSGFLDCYKNIPLANMDDLVIATQRSLFPVIHGVGSELSTIKPEILCSREMLLYLGAIRSRRLAQGGLEFSDNEQFERIYEGFRRFVGVLDSKGIAKHTPLGDIESSIQSLVKSRIKSLIDQLPNGENAAREEFINRVLGERYIDIDDMEVLGDIFGADVVQKCYEEQNSNESLTEAGRDFSLTEIVSEYDGVSTFIAESNSMGNNEGLSKEAVLQTLKLDHLSNALIECEKMDSGSLIIRAKGLHVAGIIRRQCQHDQCKSHGIG